MATYKFVNWTDINGVDLTTDPTNPWRVTVNISGETTLFANYQPYTPGPSILPWVAGIGLVAMAGISMSSSEKKEKKSR